MQTAPLRWWLERGEQGRVILIWAFLLVLCPWTSPSILFETLGWAVVGTTLTRLFFLGLSEVGTLVTYGPGGRKAHGLPEEWDPPPEKPTEEP